VLLHREKRYGIRKNHGRKLMRFKSKRRKKAPDCTTGTYRVQLYSRRALLIREFCLDARENGLEDMAAAEEHLRQTLPPTDRSSLTVALIDESPDRHSYVQFDIKPT
jgi:hypothetical protein